MPQDLHKLSQEWFELVWNQRDDSAVARLASPSLICYGLGENRQPIQGIDPFLRFRRAFLTAFPDVKVQIGDIIAEGDRCAVRFTLSGTHTGDGIGIPPTGRTFTAGAIVFCRWKDGQVIEAWNEFDSAWMLHQLQSPQAKLRA